MSILEIINSSEDVKKLSPDQLGPLCAELRDFIVRNVSQTGGHLSSNLGTVELTVALHRVYDSATDRIIFDVGHQSYAHKILTGRRESFHTLRRYKGLSGFPKPYEAPDDAFVAGHASNSVSVALGMARARTLNHENYDVVAVIGDGAMTGGLSFEGLTNAAASGEPLVIILNDNNMSISPNVGGTVSMLQTMRARPGYISFKRWYRHVFSHLPALYLFNHKVKEWFKSRLLPENIFSEMGLYYLGPVDGHDLPRLEAAIRYAREVRVPVLLHVLTKKGKGVSYTENDPELYHGVSGFDPKTGALPASAPCFSSVFGDALCELAAEDPSMVAITAAMASGTGLDGFAAAYPDRFFDVGIAEGHAVSMAAGMAKQGLTPVFAVYSSFLQRSYDMLIHDVSLQKLHVVLAVDRAGLVGNDGETHHGLFDVSFLSSIPGMSVWCPASFAEMKQMLRRAVKEQDGPVAIRYPRGGEGRYTGCSLLDETRLCEGDQLTIVCYGTLVNRALDAVYLLRQDGIEADLIKLGRICPNEFSLCLDSVKKTGRLLVVEEVCSAGCVGEHLLAQARLHDLTVLHASLLNLGDGIVTHGTVSELLKERGLDAEGIADSARKLVFGESV